MATAPLTPRPKKKQDPTIKAMGQLDRIFGSLTDKQLSLALNWAFDKHSDKHIKEMIK
jgi:hypothetical protein